MEKILDDTYMEFVYAHTIDKTVDDPDAPLSDSEDETLFFAPPRFEIRSQESVGGEVPVGGEDPIDVSAGIAGEVPVGGEEFYVGRGKRVSESFGARIRLIPAACIGVLPKKRSQSSSFGFALFVQIVRDLGWESQVGYTQED